MMYVVKTVLIVFFYALPFFSYGASGDFTVRTLVGSDTMPPSTPVALSVIPVSTSQIDVAWSASTDNFIFGGYQLFRDAVQIATTTLTSYSDSGLSASTAYTYSVRAFDSVFNYSTTSNQLATSTFAPTPTSTPQDPTATYGSRVSLSLQEFSIVPRQHSATFFWKTSTFAKFDLRWGRTTSYELGFVSHDLLRREHNTSIDDLEPGTVYEFELIGYDRLGKRFVLKRGEFKTESAPDTSAPPNVSSLSAYVVGDTVHLSWKNPIEKDFSSVRIMRSHLFFPLGMQDGFLAYEGEGTSFTDRGALSQMGVQYYTVFSIDRVGNLSSGAVIAVARDGRGVGVDKEVSVGDGVREKPDYTLTFEDFEFIQHKTPMSSKGLSADDSFLVRIAYAKLPEHLKTITITLGQSPTSASYVLKINPEKTYYEALLPSEERDGEQPVVFSVYDFKTKTMKRVSGSVLFYNSVFDTNGSLFTPFVTTLAVQSEVVTFAVCFFILFLLILIMMIRKHLHHRN